MCHRPERIASECQQSRSSMTSIKVLRDVYVKNHVQQEKTGTTTERKCPTKGQASTMTGISGSMDYRYITVQRLSSTVEGKCQKYSRIGALTIVPLASEPTLSNIKTACKNHFNLQEMECDLLAREKGPSFTDNSMITTWKVLHIRFIPKSEQECGPSREQTRNRALASPMMSEQVGRPLALPAPSKIPAPVPLSVMLQIGKLIQPKVDAVTVELEQFDLKSREWLPPFDVKVSLSKEKFASGAFRDGLQPGEKYVLKKFQEEQAKEVEKLIALRIIRGRWFQ